MLVCRVLIQAGCPVARRPPGLGAWKAGESTFARHCNYLISRVRPLLNGLPGILSGVSIDILTLLLQRAAVESAPQQPRLLFFAVEVGDHGLIRQVLAAFPGAGRWVEEGTGLTPLRAALRHFQKAMGMVPPPPKVRRTHLGVCCVLPVKCAAMEAVPHTRRWLSSRVEHPAAADGEQAACSCAPTIYVRALQVQGGWKPDPHMGLVRGFCELAGMLLQAGCPPVADLRVLDSSSASDAGDSIAGGSSTLALPAWAAGPLR